jgi:2-polyprenyl-3-methyl-5-hydroxy-6-metoxy-1,4-benzoquinol methylase
MMDRLRETQVAFDSVAADYDGDRGNNELIQDMRNSVWQRLDEVFPSGGRLIDIGCGTGLDAVRMARRGHHVTAIDWSTQMVSRTAERARLEAVTDRVNCLAVGAHELARLEGDGTYDGAYSNLGPLNCVPDLESVSQQCARLLKPSGLLLFTVIGRVCPWEFIHYGLRGRWARARIRFAPDFVAVGMNRKTIWTHYYRPREFYRHFEREFELDGYHGLCTFAPPPYLTWVKNKHPALYRSLWRLDRLTSDWPMLRDMGDHFLIVMRRRPR